MATSNSPEITANQADHDEDSSSYETDEEIREADDHPKRSKIPKRKGAATYKTKFNKEWSKTWPFVSAVRDDEHSFHCKICRRNVSCSHMGKRDVERHIGLTIHQENVKAAKSQPTLSFQPVSSPLFEKTIRAEVKVATMLVQHNIPLALADELTPLFRDVFSDSKIAQNFSSRRTKTSCIVNGAIAPFFQQSLVEFMRTNPYALAIDGSSDNGLEKMNPITVRLFDATRGIVCTQFLDMCLSSSSTAAGIFTRISEVLSTHLINWVNCVGVGLDNTSVNSA